ncbi:MAG: MFS transporter [Patescibacteria group bacterium]
MGKLFGSVNSAIKILVFGNVALTMSDGIMAPIFAIFVTQKVAPGEVSVTGYAIAVYWLVKSVLQFPIARFLDKTDGEKDDYWAMLIGGSIYVIMPLVLMFVRTPFQLYLSEFGFAIAASLYVVPWASLFTRHVDRFRIGFEWSLNSSALGFGIMGASALGGYLTQSFGFGVVFILASLFNLVGFLVLLFLRKYVKQRNHLEKAFPEQHQRTHK